MSKKNKKIKICFAGSGTFAEPIFDFLANVYEDIFLIEKCNRPKGRGLELEKTKIEEIAQKSNLETFKVSDKSELTDVLKKTLPDIVVVASFGIIIPEEALEIPRFGFLNIHPSLLPHLRGSSPIQSSILSGDKTTGLSIIKMNERLDEGPIIFQKSIEILDNDSYSSIEKKMINIATDNFERVLNDFVAGSIVPQFQKDEDATYSKKFTKEDGRLDWSEEAVSIDRKIRALNPWPGTFTLWNGKLLKIISASLDKNITRENPGTVFRHENNVLISAKNGSLILDTIQLAGKKPTSARNFILGYSDFLETSLS